MSKINQDSGNDQGKKKERVIIKEDLWGRGLPTELLELILSKLMFVVDIQKFHAVCKTWQSITVSVSPPRQLPSPLSYADSSFPLLFKIINYRKYTVFHPLYKYTWDMYFPPQLQVSDLRPDTIYFSKYGWSLIMALLDPHWFPILFNPLTQEIIQLPTTPFRPGYLSMFFTCPPPHPDCLVVAIACCYDSIYVHKLGEDDWKKHDLKGKMDHNYFQPQPCSHPILYQGLCYFLDGRRNLAVFDIKDIQHTWIVHDKLKLPSRREVPAVLTELVEHDGQLLAVLIGVDRPYIFELDLKTKSCVPMQISLEKNALFKIGLIDKSYVLNMSIVVLHG
ncbi:F-box protein [Corchorus olitorius]|uniref:F-box protein n=1 Tax=Corchorus olitorius TaxID=93759 RepID=A0A1R3JQP2_9ROSI|nr:F-box protein [Corchorus olitorius]